MFVLLVARCERHLPTSADLEESLQMRPAELQRYLSNYQGLVPVDASSSLSGCQRVSSVFRMRPQPDITWLAAGYDGPMVSFWLQCLEQID